MINAINLIITEEIEKNTCKSILKSNLRIILKLQRTTFLMNFYFSICLKNKYILIKNKFQ